MSDSMYPKLLVTLQFTLIGLMVYFSSGIQSSILGMSIFVLGLILGLWAITHNKRDNFNIQPKLKDGCKLVTSGAYNYIRHPMYSSVILMMFGVLVASPTLLLFFFFVLLIVVLVLKAKREELLWCNHDEAYLEYKNRTKLFIPYIL